MVLMQARLPALPGLRSATAPPTTTIGQVNAPLGQVTPKSLSTSAPPGICACRGTIHRWDPVLAQSRHSNSTRLPLDWAASPVFHARSVQIFFFLLLDPASASASRSLYVGLRCWDNCSFKRSVQETDGVSLIYVFVCPFPTTKPFVSRAQVSWPLSFL